MNVEQLIAKLQDVADKTKKVKFYGLPLGDKQSRYVEIDEIAIGRFVEIVSTENDGRK